MKVIAVTSAAPQEGKSTVAANLATVEASIGRRTALLECDLRRPSLARRLGISPTPGVTDYLHGHASVDQIIQDVALPSVVALDQPTWNGHSPAQPTVRTLSCVMAGSLSPNPAEVMSSPAFEELLDTLRARYDRIVVDTAPLLPVVDTRELLTMVDAVLLCVESSRTSRDEVRALKSALERVPHPNHGNRQHGRQAQ